MPGPSRRALQLQAGATSRSSQSRSVNQTNFLAEFQTRTDEEAALEEQANEEFHENMQRQAQERDLQVSRLWTSSKKRARRKLRVTNNVKDLNRLQNYSNHQLLAVVALHFGLPSKM